MYNQMFDLMRPWINKYRFYLSFKLGIGKWMYFIILCDAFTYPCFNLYVDLTNPLVVKPAAGVCNEPSQKFIVMQSTS